LCMEEDVDIQSMVVVFEYCQGNPHLAVRENPSEPSSFPRDKKC
jgi:hypothetical protein